MRLDSHTIRCNKGEAMIRQNPECLSEWDLYVDGKLIRSGYTSPEEAAWQAHQCDFGVEELNEQYAGLRISGNLDDWRQSAVSYRGV